MEPFKKGDDPRRNMKGAIKPPELTKEILDAIGPDGVSKLIKKLNRIANSKGASAASIKAAVELLDRLYGKPKQTTDIPGLKEMIKGITVTIKNG